MASAIPAYIESRIRQHPPIDLPVVARSTPVVAFGDVTKASVATLGWNPSKLEFLDNNGNELTGTDRRLETLTSLGVDDLSAASRNVVRRVFEGCNGYFLRSPYRKWFDVLEKVLRRLDVSYYTGTACHLDLVQWATDPTWGKLRRIHRESLIEPDLSFLRQQLSQENVRLLLLNGSGIAKAYKKTLDCDLDERLIPGDLGLKLYIGQTPQRARVIGWNKNLQSSFGVSNEYIKAVGAAVERARSEAG